MSQLKGNAEILTILLVVLVAIAGLLFFSTTSSPLTGLYTLGSSLQGGVPPATLSVKMQNETLMIDGATRQVEVLSFAAINGGSFNVYGQKRSEFKLVLYPISKNADSYLGKILYSQSYSKTAYTASLADNPNGFLGTFDQVVSYTPAGQSKSRANTVNLIITGQTNRASLDTAAHYSRGHVVVQDGSNGKNRGYWDVAFNYQNGETSFGTTFKETVSNTIHYARQASYTLQTSDQQQTYQIAAGFRSPAQVTLTTLAPSEFTLTETPSLAVTKFDWTCKAERGISSLQYQDGATYTLLIDQCTQNADGKGSSFTESKATCNGPMPVYTQRACAKCDSLGRSCTQYK